MSPTHMYTSFNSASFLNARRHHLHSLQHHHRSHTLFYKYYNMKFYQTLPVMLASTSTEFGGPLGDLKTLPQRHCD